MKTYRSLKFIISAGFLICSVLHAAIINVPEDHELIEDALAAIENGDTILLAPGIYHENVYVPMCEVTIASLYLMTGEKAYIAQTVVDGDSSGVVFDLGWCDRLNRDQDEMVRISGLTIQHGWENGGWGAGIVGWGGSLRLDHCIIRENSGRDGGAMFLGHANDFTIENCIFLDNHAAYGGVVFCPEDEPVFINCTFFGNRADEAGSIIFTENTCPVIVNSILWDNGDNPISGALSVLNFSNVEGGWDGEGNIDANPLFIDPDGHDFRLQADSPCIDAGTPFFVLGEDTLVDLADEEFHGEAPDMGALEYYPVEPDSINTRLVSIVELPGRCQDLEVRGDYLFAAASDGGLRIIDISQIDDPVEVGFIPGSAAGDDAVIGDAIDLVLNGDYAFVADSDTLHVIDISNQSEPQRTACYGWESYDRNFYVNMVISGNTLLYPFSYSEIGLIDISEPTEPHLAGRFDTELFATGLAVDGDVAYIPITCRHNLMSCYIVDISRPDLPQALGLLEFRDGSIQDLAVRNNQAFVLGGYANDPEAEFIIVDVSDVDNPVETGSIQGLFGRSVVLCGEYAYTAFRGFGRVLNISDHENPYEAGWFFSVEDFDCDDYPCPVAAQDRFIFVPGEGEENNTINIYRNDLIENVQWDAELQPAVTMLHPAYPNPFNSVTAIPFHLSRADHVRLYILDITGRTVTELLDSKLSTGFHKVNWDASEFRTGIYLCQIEAGEYTAARKMILLR